MKGSVSVGILPALMLAAAAGFLAQDASRALYERERAQAVAEAVALSAARVRVESLQSSATRWQKLGALFQGVAGDDILLAQDRWAAAEKEAQSISQSISGYKGRIKSVVKPAAEANGASIDDLEAVLAGELALTAQAQNIRDAAGTRKSLKAAWYRRDWGASERDARRAGDICYAVTRTWRPWVARFVKGAGTWNVRGEGRAGVDWDADSSVGTDGNGGFPRAWTEAVRAGLFAPNRPAVFTARPRDPRSAS